MDSAFFQILKREIELTLLAVDFRDANISLRIFRIRVRDHFVLFERGIGPGHRSAGSAPGANSVEIVAVHFNGMAIGFDRVLILFLLFVGISERRIKLR